MTQHAAVLLCVVLSILVITFSTFNSATGSLYDQAINKGTIKAPNPPTITIQTPQNNSNHNTNNLTISINVSIQKSEDKTYQQFLSQVYYTCDWLTQNQTLYNYSNPNPVFIQPTTLQFDYVLNLTKIPDGIHYVSFYAIEGGAYYPNLFEYFMLSANTSSTLVFTVDTKPLIVSIVSIENKTYSSSSLPLTFITNKPSSNLSYVLDEQGNVTITGNTTLTGLSDGVHNVTLYASDSIGNDSSETVYFTIEPPIPIPTLLAVAAIVIVFVVAAIIGVFSFHRKHHRLSKPNPCLFNFYN